MQIDDKVNIAFFLSLISFLWSFLLYIHSRKTERIRFYDKIYDAADWLLMYEHRRLESIEFECDDKELETAVNQYAKAHGTARLFGYAFDYPSHIVTDVEKYAFRDRVAKAYEEHHENVFGGFWRGEFSQSPVFLLENGECKTKFNQIISTIGENRSRFSKKINSAWRRTQETSVEKIKGEYESFKKLLNHTCGDLEDDGVDDPYLALLLTIRFEYRNMTKSFPDYLEELCWNTRYWIRERFRSRKND